MDTFMDQLAEKMNAQSIIRANEAGEMQAAAVRLQESADQMMQAAGRMEESVRLLREEYENGASRTVTETVKPAGDVKPVIDEDIIYIVEEEVTQLGKSLEEAKEQLTSIQWDLASKGAGVQAGTPAVKESTQSESEAATRNLDMAEIRENGAELKHGIAVLQTSLAAIDLEIARLQERLTGYGEDVSQTKEQSAGVKEILDDLREGIGGLRGELKGIRDDVGVLCANKGSQEELAGIAAGMDGIREGYVNLASGVNGIREGYADLASGVNGMREGYTGLTASVNDLRESIGRREDPAARLQEITRELTKTSEKIHADNDCIAEKLNVLTEELKAEREDQDKSLEEKLSGMNDELKEGYHKECVKVYRNVQGALKEENEKQAEQLAGEIGKLTGKGKLTLIFAILAFVMSLGSLTLQVLMMLKILP
ncbi:MAG: hypothetical protein K6F51_04145 [Acetatifactor sp.]|nr:hypothetical protein [Acetatifactor sp.]